MGLVLVVILLLVPWQVAFLGCWFFQLFTCAALRTQSSTLTRPQNAYPMTPTTPELLHTATAADFDAHSPTDSERLLAVQPQVTAQPRISDETLKNANEHLLLLMTWLLPLAAPVLAVWVRTLMTAGYTTPFDGDHNVLYVAPFLLLVEVGAAIGGFMVSRYVQSICPSVTLLSSSFAPQRGA